MMANHLGFPSNAAWLTPLAENGVRLGFDEAIYTMPHRRKELYAISERGEVREAAQGQRTACLPGGVGPTLPTRALDSRTTGEQPAGLHGQGGVQPLALRRNGHGHSRRRAMGRILGFLYATLEETSARVVFLAVLPEYRRRGIDTALHQELKAKFLRMWLL
jgi:ribosomal protein S18 acetylase RimI-like enzyme